MGYSLLTTGLGKEGFASLNYSCKFEITFKNYFCQSPEQITWKVLGMAARAVNKAERLLDKKHLSLTPLHAVNFPTDNWAYSPSQRASDSYAVEWHEWMNFLVQEIPST